MKTLTTNFNRILVSILMMLLIALTGYSQPSIQWQKVLGGTKMENGYSTVPTSDGGYIIAGEATSNDDDVSGHHGSTDTLDIWIAKTDAIGTIEWQKSFGGTGYDYCSSIIQTTDGGYAFTATVFSNDGDVIGSHGSAELWVVKLDTAGIIEWTKCYGGTGGDYGKSIRQTSDNGFIVLGVAASTNGDVVGNHGNTDLWVLKLDTAGVMQWQKCLGGTSFEGSPATSLQGFNQSQMSIIITADGGYLVASSSGSNDGDLTAHYGPVGFGSEDVWIVKLDTAGTIQWQKSMGGSLKDLAGDVLQTPDGGYMLACWSSSTDFDLTGSHGGYDSWIVKVDASGNIQNKKCLGGAGTDIPYSISATTDGGYVLAGGSTSINSGDVIGGNGLRDWWLIKIDTAITLQWQKCFGGDLIDVASSVFQTPDGGYMIGGWAGSLNDDVIGNHGGHDFWLIKLTGLPDHVINGNVYEDLNGNCIKDGTEAGLAGKLVLALPGPYYAMTDAAGNYNLFVDSGSYTVSHIPSTYYNVSCPTPGGAHNVTINYTNPNSYGNDFADTLNAHCSDVKVNIGTSVVRRCFKNTYTIHYSNIGAVSADSTTISVHFDSWINVLSSSVPFTMSGTDYVFNVGTLAAGQSGNIYVTDSVSCLPLTGLVSQCAVATISTVTTECDTLNNVGQDCHFVVTSYDPNIKEVASQDFQTNAYQTTEAITAADSLTYMIHFQNVGTDTAFTVVIRDTLSNYLDASSVELGAASHPYAFRIFGNGILEWTFNNILLPDSTTDELASHGFVKFSVKQIAGNTPGTNIYNGAAIWFDFNDAVLTNTTDSYIPLATQVVSLGTASAINVYPNPFSTSTLFALDEELKDATFVLYDVLGQEVKRMNDLSGKQFMLERDGLVNGIYAYRIMQANKIVHTGKVVIK